MLNVWNRSSLSSSNNAELNHPHLLHTFIFMLLRIQRVYRLFIIQSLIFSFISYADKINCHFKLNHLIANFLNCSVWLYLLLFFSYLHLLGFSVTFIRNFNLIFFQFYFFFFSSNLVRVEFHLIGDILLGWIGL